MRFCICICSLLIILLNTKANASPVHVDFTGYFTQAYEPNLVGTYFNGYINYDPDLIIYVNSLRTINIEGELAGFNISTYRYIVSNLETNAFSFTSHMMDIFNSAYEPCFDQFDNNGFIMNGSLIENGQFIGSTIWYSGVFDDVQFSTQPVPEPSTLFLFGAGIIAVVFLKKRTPV